MAAAAAAAAVNGHNEMGARDQLVKPSEQPAGPQTLFICRVLAAALSPAPTSLSLVG